MSGHAKNIEMHGPPKKQVCCKISTCQEFCRGNSKVVSKVPVLRVSFEEKKKVTPECHRSICLEGEVWKTMWGLEDRLLIGVCYFNQFLLTLFPPLLGNWEVSNASKSFGRRSLVAEVN